MSRYDDFRIAFNVEMSNEEIDAALTANGLIALHHALSSSSGYHSNDSSHRPSSEAHRRFTRRLTPTEHTTPRTIPNLRQSPELEMNEISPRQTYFHNDHPYYDVYPGPTKSV